MSRLRLAENANFGRAPKTVFLEKDHFRLN